MLPPVLEIYVVWHPDDVRGAEVAGTFLDHFHGNVFAGLLGGAVEVYVRSRGWRDANDAPRLIPLPGSVLPAGLLPAKFVAVVPLLGNGLASIVQTGSGPWYDYLKALVDAHARAGQIGIFPLGLDSGADTDTVLGELLGRYQQLARPNPAAPQEPMDELQCRDLAQVLAQLLGEPVQKERIKVFISHTKRAAGGDENEVAALIKSVRDIISDTRLGVFFDANDLQPGGDWDEHLRQEAASGAFLALRTDLYASREWCQREMLIAKQEGMPIVILDALSRGEERGSFLLDHVPRVPVRRIAEAWSVADIRRGLNLLVDECLKRALWRHQKELARSHQQLQRLQVAWWAPHAPEPVTLALWLAEQRRKGQTSTGELRILHPDPPLGPEERATLGQLVLLTGVAGGIDVLTPRTLAARGG